MSSAVNSATESALRSTLHSAIEDHIRFPYTSANTDTWNILELADEDPDDPTSILDIYKNATYTKAGGGNTFYNREHTWPNSYGFPNDGASNYPYTDCHALLGRGERLRGLHGHPLDAPRLAPGRPGR